MSKQKMFRLTTTIIKKNDNNILQLLSSENNELFLGYFKENLVTLIKSQLDTLSLKKPNGLPEDFWVNHIASSFVQTVNWWIKNGQKESAETICNFFLISLSIN